MGFSMQIKHLDGHKVDIVREKVTWPGARIRKKGEGMPNFENNNLHGTLYVTFDIEFPKQDFTEDQKAKLKEILGQESINKLYNGTEICGNLLINCIFSASKFNDLKA